jgi:hypothetical protein
MRAGAQYIGMGLAAGTITMTVAYTAAGTLTIMLVGLPLVIGGVVLLYLTYKRLSTPQATFSGFMMPTVGSAEAGMMP